MKGNNDKELKIIKDFITKIVLIASAKSRSVRGASHQPAFMSSCLTISHTCLPCLPSGRVSASVPGVV